MKLYVFCIFLHWEKRGEREMSLFELHEKRERQNKTKRKNKNRKAGKKY